MEDDGWKSDAVRNFERRGKSGKGAPNSTETPGTWLVLGLVAPALLILPISGIVLMGLAYLQQQAVYYDPNRPYYTHPYLYNHPENYNRSYEPAVVLASHAHPASLNIMVALALIALALCAVPCLIGLKRYENPKYLISFASGFGLSYVGTAFCFLHWFYEPSNPWMSLLR